MRRDARHGASTLGCLFSLLVVASIIYFGIGVGEVYWRNYKFEDEMRQQVRFAANKTNEQIVRQLRAFADSIGLPEAAGKVYVRRTAKDISIESDYYERVELPLYVREVHFNPHAEGPF